MVMLKNEFDPRKVCFQIKDLFYHQQSPQLITTYANIFT